MLDYTIHAGERDSFTRFKQLRPRQKINTEKLCNIIAFFAPTSGPYCMAMLAFGIFFKILHRKNVHEGEQLARALNARLENAGIDWIMTCSFVCNARNFSKQSKKSTKDTTCQFGILYSKEV
jgi:hypothetical protein